MTIDTVALNLLTYVCARTDAGRYAWYRIVGFDGATPGSSSQLEFEFTSFE